MTDLQERFREYENVPVPDLWEQITELSQGGPAPTRPARPKLLIALAASVLVLMGIGVPLFVIGTGDSPELAADVTSTTTPLSTTTSSGATSAPTSTRWQQVAVGEPWVESIADIEALPDGGFIVVTADPRKVLWTPDGIEWIDADPQRQVAAHQPSTADDRTGAQVIAATSDQVGVLDPLNAGLWVGDPQDGVWEQILFNTDDLAGDVELLAVTSNGREMLVFASLNGPATLEDRTVDPGDEPSPIPSIDQYLAWVVDPNTETVERHPLPIAAHWGWVDDTVVEWFNGRWVIYLARQVHEEPEGRTEEESLLVSPDGAAWTATAAPEDWGMSLTSLTAGSTNMIATVCHFGGDSFWYSVDGVNWFKGITSYSGHHSTYSDEIGFVVAYGGGSPLLVSSDGQSWHHRGGGTPTSGVESLAASGNMLLVDDGLRTGETDGLWLWTSE